MNKVGQQSGILNNWVTVTNWTPVNDGTYTSVVSSDELVVAAAKAAATLRLYAPVSSSSSYQTLYVSVFRAGVEVLAGTVPLNGGTTSGTIDVSTSIAVAAGDRFGVKAKQGLNYGGMTVDVGTYVTVT